MVSLCLHIANFFYDGLFCSQTYSPDPNPEGQFFFNGLDLRSRYGRDLESRLPLFRPRLPFKCNINAPISSTTTYHLSLTSMETLQGTDVTLFIFFHFP